jgi:cell division protein FtsB
LNSTQPKASRARIHLAAPDRLLWVVVVGVILWGVWAFGSELWLNVRLAQQVESLKQQNANLAVSNDQVRSQLKVADSPAALEEAARKQGYARSSERVYVIVSPSGAAGDATAGLPAATRPRQNDGGVLGTVARWWRNLWH